MEYWIWGTAKEAKISQKKGAKPTTGKINTLKL
jgi:hypothetical protein